MTIYSVQTFNGRAEEWMHLSPVHADPDRDKVIDRFLYYIKTRSLGTAKAKSRQYRLCKFHYGGCRHLDNPSA